MNQFLRKIALLVIIPLIVLYGLVEVLVRHIPNDYYFKNQWLTLHANEINILALGSSTSYRGIDPRYFSQKAFNAALVSQDFNMDQKIFEKFIGNCDGLKFVVIPLTYHSFWHALEVSDESWRKKNYYIFFGFEGNRFEPKYHLACYGGNLFSLVRRIYSYYINGESEINCDGLGFGRKYRFENRGEHWEADGELKAKNLNKSFNEKLFAKNLKTIRSIIEVCKRRNVKVVLPLCPSWHTYTDYLDKKQLDLVYATCNGLVSENRNVIFVDMLCDKRFVAGDFYDVNHLNEFGARKLTTALDSLILQQSGSQPENERLTH